MREGFLLTGAHRRWQGPATSCRRGSDAGGRRRRWAVAEEAEGWSARSSGGNRLGIIDKMGKAWEIADKSPMLEPDTVRTLLLSGLSRRGHRPRRSDRNARPLPGAHRLDRVRRKVADRAAPARLRRTRRRDAAGLSTLWPSKPTRPRRGKRPTGTHEFHPGANADGRRSPRTHQIDDRKQARSCSS